VLKNLNVKQVFCLSVILLALTGCAAKKTQPSMSGLLLAEPEMVSAKAQISIARYTDTLYRVQLTEEERAEVLFQRGVVFDSMGLTALARRDYTSAITLNPALGSAYNSLGVIYIQAGLHMQAYEAFDAALDIAPDYDYALLNRGVAFYYGGRADLAIKDTAQYLSKDPSDPFRLLWHYLVFQENYSVEESQVMLGAAKVWLNENDWASRLVELFMGQATESEVIAAMVYKAKSQTELNYLLCEAYFYIGKYNALRGQYAKAENYYKLALATNAYEYIEHKYARIELDKVSIARSAQLQAQE
jgi:lipoprotein NlpI